MLVALIFLALVSGCHASESVDIPASPLGGFVTMPAPSKKVFRCSRGHEWKAEAWWLMIQTPSGERINVCPYCIAELLNNSPAMGKVSELEGGQ